MKVSIGSFSFVRTAKRLSEKPFAMPIGIDVVRRTMLYPGPIRLMAGFQRGPISFLKGQGRSCAQCIPTYPLLNKGFVFHGNP